MVCGSLAFLSSSFCPVSRLESHQLLNGDRSRQQWGGKLSRTGPSDEEAPELSGSALARTLLCLIPSTAKVSNQIPHWPLLQSQNYLTQMILKASLIQLETPVAQGNDPTEPSLPVVGWAELGRDACHTQAKIQRQPPISLRC